LRKLVIELKKYREMEEKQRFHFSLFAFNH
jgi:hypothetical protein